MVRFPSQRHGRRALWVLVSIMLATSGSFGYRPALAQTAPLPPSTPIAPDAPALMKPAAPAAPTNPWSTPPTPVKLPPFQVPVEPRRTSLDLSIVTPPSVVTVGDTVPFSITLRVGRGVDAEQVVVTLAPPAGTRPVAGTNLTAPLQGWRWDLGTRKAESSVTLTGTIAVQQVPVGRALRLAPQVTARDVPAVTAAAGAVVTPPPAAARTTFTVGTGATLQSADGRVQVQFSPKGFDRPLQLRHRALTDALADRRGQKLPIPGALPYARPGLGAFVLDATDTLGVDVHQFTQPVTITVSYTPEQLDALQIPEGALALFWFDETQRRWVKQPSVIDSANHTVSSVVQHFSVYQLGTDLSPSEAFIPSVKSWQVDLLTGAATSSYPIEVPAGAGGMRPSLNLTYNSTQTDGNQYVYDKKQSSWVGKGWDLNVPYIARNRYDGGEKDTFSLVLNGSSSELVRGKQLAGFTTSRNYLTGWDWRPSNENFMRVRYDRDPDYGSAGWIVWTTDGTRYEFFEAARQKYDNDDTETYKWMVSRVVDTHGNYTNYTYNKITTTGSCAVNPDIWPREIRWGGNLQTSAPVRYSVVFTSTARQGQSATDPDVADNNWNDTLDMVWDYSSNICNGDKYNSPHETRRLQVVEVRSNPSLPYVDAPAQWLPVRQYRFTTNYSLKSDETDANPKLTLTQLQVAGKDALTVLPATTFSYRATNPGKHRLETVNNGQGGSLTFAYTALPDVYTIAQANTLFGNNAYNPNVYTNRYRVNQRTTTASSTSSYVTAYTYGPFAVNAGNQTKLNPRPASNSAVIERAQHLDTGSNDIYEQLVTKQGREFRGHESVTEKTYNTSSATGAPAQWIEHYFRLGDVLDVSGCGADVTYQEDGVCYRAQRTREFQKGREWQTIWKDGTGGLLKSVVHTFALGMLPDIVTAPQYDSTLIDYTDQINRGIWRAFVYEQETNEQIYEGQGTPKVHRTTYAYDPVYQQAVQAGNLTRKDEYFANTNKARTTTWSYLRRADANVTCTVVGQNPCATTTVVGGYIVDRLQQEAIYDSSNANGTGNLVALREQFFDNTADPGYAPTKGELRRTVRYHDVNAVSAPTTDNRTLNGVNMVYAYDSYGNPTQATSYAGTSTRANNGITVTWGAPTGLAATTTTAYDPRFNQYSITTTNPPNANSVQTNESAGYDFRVGTLTSVTDTNGIVTSAEYDVFGRINKLIRPGDTSADPTAGVYYDDNSQPVRYEIQAKRTNAVNGDPLYEKYWFYDGLGRVIQTKDESSDTSTVHIITDMRYDALGQVIAQSQPRYPSPAESFPASVSYTNPGVGELYRQVTTTYDGLGRVFDVTDPALPVHQTTKTRYYQSTDGWTISTTDVNDHKVRQEYDVLGRMVVTREYPTGASQTPDSTTTYAYNPLDLLTQTIADYGATNITTGVGYDSAERKISMTDPDMGAWTYSYDGRGNLLIQKDARNITTAFGYDLLSRLTQKTFSNGDPTITYGYDDTTTHTNGKSQRTSMCVSNGSGGCTVVTDWNYDTRGHPVKQTQTAGTITRAMQWTYGPDNLVATMTYPDAHTLSYTYDMAGRQVWACLEGSLGCVAANAQYTALGQPAQRTAGNNVVTTWSYNNNLSRLDRLVVGNVFDRSYGYDNGPNVTSITDNKLAANTQGFSYDARDRLTSWTLNGATQSYTYNKIGNLTNKAGTGYNYGQQLASCATGSLSKPHAVVQAGSNAYCYDQDGNMLSGSGRTYTWNAQNQPTQIVQTGLTESYTYDGDTNRVLRTNGSTTTFYLAGLWEEVIGGEQRAYYPFNDAIVAMSKGSTRLYLHGDHLNSVSLLTTSTQAVTETQEFDPWGKVRAGNVSQTTRNFTGQELDSTGLLFYHARYYDPNLGRFLSADNIVPGGNALTASLLDPTSVTTQSRNAQAPLNPQEHNRYSYVLNNPLSYADPTGHCRRISGKFVYAEDCTVDEFNELSWDDRKTWVSEFESRHGLNGWFDDIEVAIDFFSYDSDFSTINQDNWVARADAAVLQAIQNGQRLNDGLVPIGEKAGQACTGSCYDAAVGWKQFYDAIDVYNRTGTEPANLYDARYGAEQKGVNYGAEINARLFDNSSIRVRNRIIAFVSDGNYYRQFAAYNRLKPSVAAPYLKWILRHL